MAGASRGAAANVALVSIAESRPQGSTVRARASGRCTVGGCRRCTRFSQLSVTVSSVCVFCVRDRHSIRSSCQIPHAYDSPFQCVLLCMFSQSQKRPWPDKVFLLHIDFREFSSAGRVPALHF